MGARVECMGLKMVAQNTTLRIGAAGVEKDNDYTYV